MNKFSYFEELIKSAQDISNDIKFQPFSKDDHEDTSILIKRILKKIISLKLDDSLNSIYQSFINLMDYLQKFDPEDVISQINPELLEILDPAGDFWEFIDSLKDKLYSDLNKYEKENLKILYDILSDINRRLFVT